MAANDDTPFVKLWIKAHITDDKDQGDEVRFLILGEDGTVFADSGYVGRELTWHDGYTLVWGFEGPSLGYKRDFRPSESGQGKILTMYKQGSDQGFQASFRLVGWTQRDTPYRLLDTPEVLFGSRNPLTFNPVALVSGAIAIIRGDNIGKVLPALLGMVGHSDQGGSTHVWRLSAAQEVTRDEGLARY